MLNKSIFIMFLFITNIFAINLPKTYIGSFEQTIASVNNSKIEYKGKLLIDTNSDKILWHYKEPIDKTILIIKQDRTNDYKIYIVEPELEQVIINNNKNIDIINNLINIDESLIKNGSISIMESGIYYEFKLMKVGFNYYPIEISWKDDLENDIVIKFIDIEIDQNIDESMSINIPENFDIINK